MWYTATQHGQQAFKLLAGPQKEFSFQFSLTCVLISFLLFGACLRFWRLDHRLYVKDGCDYHLSWGHLHSVIQSSGLCEDCSRSLMFICIWDHCLGNTQLCPISSTYWFEVKLRNLSLSHPLCVIYQYPWQQNSPWAWCYHHAWQFA